MRCGEMVKMKLLKLDLLLEEIKAETVGFKIICENPF